MSDGKPVISSLVERVAFYKQAMGFEGLDSNQLTEIAQITALKNFKKGETVFHQGSYCSYFPMVFQGLVRVSFCSTSGFRMTYPLASDGEPLNLVGPLTDSPRFLSAKAIKDLAIGRVKRDDFLSFAFKHPKVLVNFMTILGQAIDSANSRIIDMIEKRVEQRLIKVLYTLFKKFGSSLRFTSAELAELTGTTTESTLRAMSKLRDLCIIKSRRGKIIIVDTHRPECLCSEILWV